MERIFYLAQVFGGLNTLCVVLVSLLTTTFIFVVIGVIASKNEGDEIPKEVTKMFRTILLIIFISILGVIFIPTKKTFLFMVGSRAVDSIVEENPKVKELPENTINLLNEYIKAETEKVKAKNENDD